MIKVEIINLKLNIEKPIFQLGALPFLFAELFKITILTLLANKLIKLREFI